MAYNPFNIFRRNQKALFAVLTVFVMVVFTLSSGVAGGDFFETFSQVDGRSWGRRGRLQDRRAQGHDPRAGGRAAELAVPPRDGQPVHVHAALQTMGGLLEYAGQQRERLSPQGSRWRTRPAARSAR